MASIKHSAKSENLKFISWSKYYKEKKYSVKVKADALPTMNSEKSLNSVDEVGANAEALSIMNKEKNQNSDASECGCSYCSPITVDVEDLDLYCITIDSEMSNTDDHKKRSKMKSKIAACYLEFHDNSKNSVGVQEVPVTEEQSNVQKSKSDAEYHKDIKSNLGGSDVCWTKYQSNTRKRNNSENITGNSEHSKKGKKNELIHRQNNDGCNIYSHINGEVFDTDQQSSDSMQQPFLDKQDSDKTGQNSTFDHNSIKTENSFGMYFTVNEDSNQFNRSTGNELTKHGLLQTFNNVKDISKSKVPIYKLLYIANGHCPTETHQPSIMSKDSTTVGNFELISKETSNANPQTSRVITYDQQNSDSSKLPYISLSQKPNSPGLIFQEENEHSINNSHITVEPSWKENSSNSEKGEKCSRKVENAEFGISDISDDSMDDSDDLDVDLSQWAESNEIVSMRNKDEEDLKQLNSSCKITPFNIYDDYQSSESQTSASSDAASENGIDNSELLVLNSSDMLLSYRPKDLLQALDEAAVKLKEGKLYP